MAFRTNRRAFLAGLESTYKNAAATASEAMLARSINITPLAGNDISREFVRAYYGNNAMVAGEKHVEVDIELELAGSGAAGSAPKYGLLLQACGMKETLVASKTATYTPISKNEKSLVIHAHADGSLHKIRGARGSFSITANADNIPVIAFKFLGLIEPVTAVNIPSASPSSWPLAQPINTRNSRGLSLFGATATWSEFTLDMAISTVHRKVVGNNDVVIVDRKPAGTAQIEDPGVSGINLFEKAQDVSLGVAKFDHGIGAGNLIEISMPKVSIGSPAYADKDGVQMLNINYVPTPVSGDDEVSIVFK